MTRHRIILLSLILARTAPGLVAQEVQSVTLDEAMTLFAANNLELRIARDRAARADGLARQAEAFPNPTISVSHEPLGGDGRSYSESYFNLSQRIELPGRRDARSAAAERRRDAARALVRADSLRLGFEAKRAFLEAVLADEILVVTERVAGVFDEASESARERYEAGDLSLYELRRIEVEQGHYQTLRTTASLDQGRTQRALALVVDPEGDRHRLAAEPPSLAEPPTITDADIDALGVSLRPELAAAQAELESAAAAARLARADRLPDLTATGGYKRQSDDLRGAFLALSIPVPLFDRGGGAVTAAAADLRAEEERLALTRRQLENDLRRAADAYRGLATRTGLVGAGTVPEAADLLDIALVSYEAGEMELVELLDAAEALHRASTAEARLRVDLWIAYFDLERAMGGFGAATTIPAEEDEP